MNHPTRKTVLTAVTLLLLLTGVLYATPAAADPPERNLPPSEVVADFTLPAGEFCAFDVHVHIEGKEAQIFFDDRILLLAPGLTATLTNTDTGQSTTVNVSGPGKVIEDFNPDGSGTVTIHQYGSWLHMHPGQLYIATGYVIRTLEFDPGFELVSEHEDLSRARTVDLCAQLAG